MTFLDPLEMDAFRREAESLFTDVFTAYRPTGYTRAADGMETPSYEQVGRTPGKIQARGGSSRDTSARTQNVAGVDRPIVEGGLHIPVDAQAPTLGPKGVGWEYVLTSPGPFTPHDLAGSRWLVVDSPAKSFQTARRLDVVRLS